MAKIYFLKLLLFLLQIYLIGIFFNLYMQVIEFQDLSMFFIQREPLLQKQYFKFCIVNGKPAEYSSKN